MRKLDPDKILAEVKKAIPAECHEHIVVIGSLAAACHFRQELEGNAVNTKDADFVIQPAGNTKTCQRIADILQENKWTPRLEDPKFKPQPMATPKESLAFVRLYPPGDRDFFIEFLGLPAVEQQTKLDIVSVKLAEGWYGIPCYRFMGLVAVDQQVSKSGLKYAAPGMMALANLLSHPEIGTQRMTTPILGREILRSAKDLGRVLAIAWLSGRDGTEQWVEPWLRGMKECFPKSWRALAKTVDIGIRALVRDADAFEEAHHTTRFGLLNGKDVTVENLRAVADQLLVDIIEPFKNSAV